MNWLASFIALFFVFYYAVESNASDMVFVCKGDEALIWDKRKGKDTTPKVYDISKATRKVLVQENTATIYFSGTDDWRRIVKEIPGFMNHADGSLNYSFNGHFVDYFYSFVHNGSFFNEPKATVLSILETQGSVYIIEKFYCE